MRKLIINGKEFAVAGNNVFCALPALFAAEASKQHNLKTLGYDYQANYADLSSLVDSANEVTHGALDAVATIGALLAYVDAGEVVDQLQQVGWLLNGLATIGMQANQIQQGMQYDLSKRSVK